MILLPHGCSCSQPSVNPKNWKTCGKSALQKAWRIQYYFRDPQFKDKYPYGKLIPIKGMNALKTLEERREAVQMLIDEELYMLKVKGYNPITKQITGPELSSDFEIHPETFFCEALEAAYKRIDAADSTLSDLRTVKKYFIKSIKQLRYHTLRIKDVKRSHVRNVLENQKQQNSYSNKRYNKARAYIQMLFKELVFADALENNPINDIRKKTEIKEIREILTDNELKRVKAHLEQNHYGFYRYAQIFFHSGCRSTEMFRLKRKDVDLKNGRFKVLVKKGKDHIEQFRAININAHPYWEELCMESNTPNDYLFSYRFSPGDTKISERQVTIKWKKYVKDVLGITADFYAFKHLHTTKVINSYDSDLAAKLNGHTSTRMNEQHYDVMYKNRNLEKARNVNVQL